MTRPRVLIVDDQALIRDGLMTLLGMAEDIEVTGAAADGAAAVALVEEQRPDVVLMDLRMPGLDGVAATREIKTRWPATEIVVLTTHADDVSILDALGAGARGYLTKDAGIAEIRRAIQAVAAGQSLLDPVVQARLLAAARGEGSEAAALPGTDRHVPAGAGPIGPPPAENPDELTPREREVLSLIAAGCSNAEIAASLFVSAATVKTHINHVFAKIGARDRAQAVRYAYEHGLTA